MWRCGWLGPPGESRFFRLPWGKAAEDARVSPAGPAQGAPGMHICPGALPSLVSVRSPRGWPGAAALPEGADGQARPGPHGRSARSPAVRGAQHCAPGPALRRHCHRQEGRKEGRTDGKEAERDRAGGGRVPAAHGVSYAGACGPVPRGGARSPAGLARLRREWNEPGRRSGSGCSQRGEAESKRRAGRAGGRSGWRPPSPRRPSLARGRRRSSPGDGRAGVGADHGEARRCRGPRAAAGRPGAAGLRRKEAAAVVAAGGGGAVRGCIRSLVPRPREASVGPPSSPLPPPSPPAAPPAAPGAAASSPAPGAPRSGSQPAAAGFSSFVWAFCVGAHSWLSTAGLNRAIVRDPRAPTLHISRPQPPSSSPSPTFLFLPEKPHNVPFLHANLGAISRTDCKWSVMHCGTCVKLDHSRERKKKKEGTCGWRPRRGSGEMRAGCGPAVAALGWWPAARSPDPCCGGRSRLGHPQHEEDAEYDLAAGLA